MKSEVLKGKVEEYQGKKLEKAIDYEVTVELYENVTEAKGSEEWPNDSDCLVLINNKRKTGAKAGAYQRATQALKEQYENSPEYKRKQLINAATLAGFSLAEAEALAASKLLGGNQA